MILKCFSIGKRKLEKENVNSISEIADFYDVERVDSDTNEELEAKIRRGPIFGGR